MDEIADAGELHDAVKPLFHLLPGQPEQRCIDVHVFSAGQIPVKSRAQLQQSGHAAVDLHAAFAGRTELGCYIQQRALACAVLAYNRQALAAPDSKRDIPQSEKMLARPRTQPPASKRVPNGLEISMKKMPRHWGECRGSLPNHVGEDNVRRLT